MPGKVKVKIVAGRNLPVMDRSSDTTDAYVEVKLASTTYKTDVCRKTLHPVWDSDWYRFEVDDSELQDEPLQIRLMDHDTYSANDAIGKVYLDLNPLLLPAAGLLRTSNDTDHLPNSTLSGWIPVYDTMHGIRGEVQIIVKVELFTDFNKFRQSSCGVQFFCSPAIPQGFYAQVVHGFVEELVVNDDPEYQWIDKIRTPRASNEARQTLFFKLSGELQRKIGVKALDLGGNSVIGYSQSFDLEGDSGIVARGIGTAVTLIKIPDTQPYTPHDNYNEERAVNYIKFLSSDKGFHLNKKPHVSNYNVLFSDMSKPCNPLSSHLPLHLNKSLSNIESTPKVLIKQNTHIEFAPLPKPLIQHSHSLQTLLKQEDMRGIPGTGLTQRIKNFKYSSQNIFSKKITALKAKLTDSGTEIEPKAVSTGDLGKTKKKIYKFRRTISDSSTMAEVLVRSVLHVHSSLDCIMESPPNLPIFQKQISLNDTCVDKNDGEQKTTSLLSLPDDTLDVSSNPSEVSESSSSCDEEASESKDSRIDYDTVSGIVRNVRKLSMLSTSTSEAALLQNVDIMEQHLEVDSNDENEESSHSIKDSTASAEDLEKAQWEFDLETNKKENRDDNKKKVVFEMANEAEEQLDEFTTHSSDGEKENTPNNIFNTHLTPPLSNDTTDRKFIIPPIMMGAEIENKGLLKTAMEVMLLEKVNIMGTYTPPTSPTIHTQAKVFHLPSHPTPTSPEKNQSFFSKIVQTYEFIRRSSTSTTLSDYNKLKKFNSLHNLAGKSDLHRSMLSLQDHDQQKYRGKHDTVLGAPFTSLHNRNMEIKRSNIKSNSVAHSPAENVYKHRYNSLDDVTIKTSKHHSFFCKAEKKVKNALHAPFALFHRSSKKKNNKSEKQHGLLGTALENVLRDTVHDLLIASHVEDKEKNDKDVAVKVETSENKVHTTCKHTENSDLSKKTSDAPLVLPQRTICENANKILKDVDNEIDDNYLMETETSVINKNLNDCFSASLSVVPITTNATQNFPKTMPILPINIEIEGNNNANKVHASFAPFIRLSGSPLPDQHRQEHGHQRTESMGAKISHSPAKLNTISCIHRRSSDSDLSITPKGNSLTGSDRSGGATGFQMMKKGFIRSTVPHENFDYMEYPFLTMTKYPPGFITYLGGAVSARSVKLLERISNLEEPESRDTWWSEIRMEIRSHARALNCNAVLNYSESTTICDDVCVLSANGTAAVIGYHQSYRDSFSRLPTLPKHHSIGKDICTSLDRTEIDKDRKPNEPPLTVPNPLQESPERDTVPSLGITTSLSCAICHLPYGNSTVNLRTTSFKCRMCGNAKVPEVLITSIEIPEGIPTVGRGCFLQSFVCRPLKDLKGESYAKEISDGLPFLEYELHRILVNKLKVKGMNSVFGLKVRISIGEKMMIGIATGTAVFLSALPTPSLPKLVSDRSVDDKKLAGLQKDLHETVRKNKEVYQIKPHEDNQNGIAPSDTEESEDEQTVLELSLASKDCCILEIDDPEDAEVVNLLMEPRPPDGFHVVNTESVPGLDDLEIVKNLQMFIQIWRAKVQPPYNLDKNFHRLLETVYFKLRRMIPCALCDLQFRVESPEPDEIQLCVLGMALGLGDPQKNPKRKLKPSHSKRNEEDLQFNLEDINQIPENDELKTSPNASSLHTQMSKHRQKSPQRRKLPVITQRHTPYRERHGVDITPLSYVPGGKIERYLGNLNFFFIRETTSIREEGGLSGFIHSFITEVLAIVRAHVTALGGNAMVAYFMTECVLNHNLHKNQVILQSRTTFELFSQNLEEANFALLGHCKDAYGQCLVNIGGDVVAVSYYSEDQ